MESSVSVPGRVNLIGEHIDYLGFPVLPMAITRRLTLRFTPRPDRLIRVSSPDYGTREFEWLPALPPYPPGDFGNYVKAAAQAVATRWGSGKWGLSGGFDGTLTSTIPAAAGLSSSSALVTAVTLALLRLGGIEPDFEALMEVLPEGERYVGTRGGGMDHAVCLAGRKGCALRLDFDPVRFHAEPIPPVWAFFVAHSLRRAEKSGAARDEYNHRRALAQSGDPSALRHAKSERERVEQAIAAMRRGDLPAFGALLDESHRSLRDDLRVSCEQADRLVESCRAAGAAGARIMGAGFGGYVLGVCDRRHAPDVLGRLERDHFAGLPERAQFPDYLMQVEAGEGALSL
ncbi:MAG: galactokinase family protein [Acidobacteriota bacterium]